MGVFDSILKNESVQKMAFSHLKSVFKDGKVKAIVISVDDNRETVIDLYETEITVIEHDPSSDIQTRRIYGAGNVVEIQGAPDSAPIINPENSDNATPELNN